MTDLISVKGPARRPLPATDAFDLLANRRTRKVLATLREQTGGVTKQDLATIVASRERGTALHEVTTEQRRTVLTSLHHKHLPKLRENALVDVDDEGLVVPSDTSALSGNTLVSAALDLPADDDAKDVTFEALASEVRRTLIETLRTDGVATVQTLVETATRNSDLSETDAVVALTHTHLPKLDGHGVVSYDRATERVSYEGLPVDDETALTLLDVVPEFDAETTETAKTVVPESADVWTIRGRENVVGRGQQLFDRAEDELFLMLTTDGLLEQGCLEKLHDALDRGVDVYLGSQTKAVRDLVREEAPSVTIWEPQLNWLNLPPTHETLGRLVMVDREAVMLGTLGERRDDGGYTERALTGEGHANPLVILMREALGARLDHLDGQSDDVLSQLPL